MAGEAVNRGRQRRHQAHNVAFNNLGRTMIGGVNPARVAWLISSSSTDSFGLFSQGTVNFISLVEMQKSQTQLVLDVETYGDVVTGELWAQSDTVGITVAFLEIVDTDPNDPYIVGDPNAPAPRHAATPTPGGTGLTVNRGRPGFNG
jgi:hypothetical protein